MRKDLENFVKSIKSNPNILKVFLIEYIFSSEVLLVIGERFEEKFEKRGNPLLKLLPENTNIKIVCYSVPEIFWLKKERNDFLEALSENSYVLFDKKKLNSLLKVLKKPNESKIGKNEKFISWADKFIKKSIDLKFIRDALFDVSKKDLESAKILLENGFFSQSIFLIHQFFEKLLKGLFLEKFKKRYPKSHSLEKIYSEISDKQGKTYEKIKVGLGKLEKLYMASRYPIETFSGKIGRPIEITKKDVEFFLELAKEFEKESEFLLN